MGLLDWLFAGKKSAVVDTPDEDPRPKDSGGASIDLAKIEDEPSNVYIFGVDVEGPEARRDIANHVSNVLEFEYASYIVFSESINGEGGLEVISTDVNELFENDEG